MTLRILYILMLAGALLWSAPQWTHAESKAKVKWLRMTMEVGRGTGDDPMTVIWLETKKKKFIKTVYMISRDKEWFKSLETWHKKHTKYKESKKHLDAVTGATMKWKSRRTVWLPLVVKGKHLVDGEYVLRFETRRDKGGHYRSLKIEIDKGLVKKTYTHKGYLKKVTVTPYVDKPARKKSRKRAQ